jgi:ATP-dependent 26S proteasome regulatory subunit
VVRLSSHCFVTQAVGMETEASAACLPEELVFLRLREALRANESSRARCRVQNVRATDDALSRLEERISAVRSSKYILGRYGVDDGGTGSLAWHQAEPIRIQCNEEALKVRVEARRQHAKLQERLQDMQRRMSSPTMASLDLSLADGARRSGSLAAVHALERGCVMLRLKADAKRSLQYNTGAEAAREGGAKKLAGAAAPRGPLPGSRPAFDRPAPVAPAPPAMQAAPAVTHSKPCMGGFGSAKTEYIQNLKKEGKKPPASFGDPNKKMLQQQQQPPNGATRLDAESQKHLPPYMRKALQSMNSLSNNNSVGGKAGAGQKANGEEKEGPMSHRTFELLGLDPDEPLPDELGRIDPAMIEQVCNEIIDSSASVAWEDIAGQEAAKRLIQEVVVWPMMNPDIFKGARAPPKGILLFGPPGTGKTLLGKAIASNIDASFFAISASSLTSKWIGDGEKMVKALFAVAGWMAPSVIFIDEIDSILSARKSEGEHESSRRLKTEILVQMEGCDPASAERKVLLVGATNRPEELDEAARRRMPKQMYIPLPCDKAREEMIHRVLTRGSIASNLSAEDIAKIVTKTAGYSGSDMKNLIQEACQGPIREAVRRAGAAVATLKEQDLRPVVVKDFAVASKAQRASTEPSEIVRYEEYNRKHGAKIVDDAAEMEEDDCSEGWL